MKNKYMESLRKRWKIKGTSWRNSVDGIFIYHCYNEPKEQSWWDDFGFYINGVYHVVWWTHPRMKFKDEIENLAHAEVQHLYPRNRVDNLFADGKKNYKKVGKSRKKVVTIEYSAPSISMRAWFKKFEEAEDKLLKTSEYVAMPHIKTTWLKYGKGIDICYPVELLDEKSIIKFAKELRDSIISGVPLDYSGYAGYSKEDWGKEGHKSRLERAQQLEEIME